MRIEKKHLFRLFFIATIVIILLPYSLRTLSDNATLPGQESYYHARIAEQIIDEGIPKQDNFAFFGRTYVFNPYHFMLAIFSYIFGIINASRILPLVLGMLSVIIFYFILRKLKLNQLACFSVLGVFVLSPMFMYAFSTSTPLCLMIFLNLLGFYLFIQNKRHYTVLAAVLFGVNSLFGIMHALLSGSIVFFYSLYHKKKLKSAYLILVVIILIILAYSVPVYLQLESADFIEKNLVTNFVSDLGGIAGFSIFSLILCLLGFIFVWKYKQKYYSLYAFSIFLIIYSIFDKSAAVYSNFIIIFLAGIAISHLARMKWRLERVRDLSLIVLFCGLLFSSISHAVMLSNLQPNEDIKDALTWLNHRSDPGERVFSHYSKGFWIEYWAEQPVLMDSLFETAPNAEVLYKDSEAIFHSNDIRVTRDLLTLRRIQYIFITKDMSEGLVWKKDGQGLNFLLANNETFKKRYNNPYCEIYEYTYAAK